MGYQHPLAPPMQLNVEHNRLIYVSAEIVSQEYNITQRHWMKPIVPNEWPPYIIFQSFERHSQLSSEEHWSF